MDIEDIWCACYIQKTFDCLTVTQPIFWYDPNETVETDLEEPMKKNKGFGILISVGKYAGFYIAGGWARRICLGWIAITFFPVDGDVMVQLAAKGADATRIENHLSKLDCQGDFQVVFPDKE